MFEGKPRLVGEPEPVANTRTIDYVLPVDAEDYEKRVAVGTGSLDAFANQLVSELDIQDGGFPSWAGHCDWKTLALLADYLIQSVNGSAEALLSASLAARTHRQMTFAEGEAHRQALREGRQLHPLDAQGRRRALTITQSAETCFFHLGQTLDRLAAAVVIVGGFEVNDVVKIDWGQVEELAEAAAKASTAQRLQPIGSTGRAAQDALLAPVLDWQPFGPTEWLPWTRDTRNGMTHRAGAKKMMISATGNQLARVFYRQPRWSELQSLVFGARPPKKPFFDAFIMSASQDVLDGLCESMAKFVEAVTKAMVACWNARAADPAMIVQHGRQWRVIEPTEAMSNFPGYGNPVVPVGTAMMINPLSGRRWQAARVMDERRQDWY
ncbi:hypothetical protein ABQE62_06550 [Mycolicibacterium fortuitum]